MFLILLVLFVASVNAFQAVEDLRNIVLTASDVSQDVSVGSYSEGIDIGVNHNFEEALQHGNQVLRFDGDSVGFRLQRYNGMYDANSMFDIIDTNHNRRVIYLDSEEQFGDETFCHESPDYYDRNGKYYFICGFRFQNIYVDAQAEIKENDYNVALGYLEKIYNNARILANLTCSDTDSGKDYYEKGMLTYGDFTDWDNCNGDVLNEGYCDSSKSYHDMPLWFESYDCPNGCSDGACIQNTSYDCNYLEDDQYNYFEICKNSGYEGVCFDKYTGVYQGCSNDDGYGCVVSNTNAARNIFCEVPNDVCTDSDKGMNYYVKGMTRAGTEVREDSCTYCTGDCHSGSPCEIYCGAVVENYCSSGVVKQKTQVCEFGCQYGECKESDEYSWVLRPEEYYKDVDPSLQGEWKGTCVDVCEDLGLQAQSTCLAWNDDSIYCRKTMSHVGGLASAGTSCTETGLLGKVGSDFCCCGEKEQQSCTDSDGGINYYVKGKTYPMNWNNEIITFTDNCKDNIILEEGGCFDEYGPVLSGGFAAATDYECPYGCKDGACIQDISLPKIVDIAGEKSTYYQKEQITLKIKAIESDGTPAASEEGFHIQYYTYDKYDSDTRLEEYIPYGKYNAVYRNNYWYIDYWAPSNPGSYYTKIALYCSRYNTKCSETYPNLQVEEKIYFTVSDDDVCSTDTDCEAIYSYCSCDYVCMKKTDEIRVDCARACPEIYIEPPECECSNGNCVESGQLCEPGVRCNGNYLQKCYSDQGWKNIEYCSQGCEDGKCIEKCGDSFCRAEEIRSCPDDCEKYEDILVLKDIWPYEFESASFEESSYSDYGSIDYYRARYSRDGQEMEALVMVMKSSSVADTAFRNEVLNKEKYTVEKINGNVVYLVDDKYIWVHNNNIIAIEKGLKNSYLLEIKVTETEPIPMITGNVVDEVIQAKQKIQYAVEKLQNLKLKLESQAQEYARLAQEYTDSYDIQINRPQSVIEAYLDKYPSKISYSSVCGDGICDYTEINKCDLDCENFNPSCTEFNVDIDEFEECIESGGKWISNENLNGCPVPPYCVRQEDEELTEVEKLTIIMKLESLSIRITELRNKALGLAKYHEKVGNDYKARIWYQAAESFQNLINKINAIQKEVDNSSSDRIKEIMNSFIPGIKQDLNEIIETILLGLSEEV